jgi:hypothetical protein
MRLRRIDVLEPDGHPGITDGVAIDHAVLLVTASAKPEVAVRDSTAWMHVEHQVPGCCDAEQHYPWQPQIVRRSRLPARDLEVCSPLASELDKADADVICDVGGTDVKIMILRQGTVADFRLNSQCSSGNGAFLQGVAERYDVPLAQYADQAFRAKSIPALAMGCGVFLQSDIVNQQRKGWSSEEIMASLAAVLPLNVWVYAGQLQNLAAAGQKFVLQGGTHRNMAVVKAQVDFIRGKVPQAEIVVHPYSGEAGAIGAALCAADWLKEGAPTRFRGFDIIESLEYTSTTNEHTTCNWCPVSCKRTFIDVRLADGKGRPWSKVPVAAGWERVISGNSCPKGLLEDVNEMRIVKKSMEAMKDAHPNTAEMVRENAFRRAKAPA